MALTKFPTPRVRHVRDGSLWEASWEVDEFGRDLWMVGLFNRDRAYYFRKLELNIARRWWCWWRPKYGRTGEVWIGGDMRKAGFEVL
jgi:hypothetical protein